MTPVVVHGQKCQPKQFLTRGGQDFEGEIRIPAGHPEGFLERFATLYHDFAKVIRGDAQAADILPNINAGLAGMEFIAAAVKSSKADGEWWRFNRDRLRAERWHQS